MLASHFDRYPNQITDWKKQLRKRGAQVFALGKASAEPAGDVKVLHAKIGQLALQNDFLERALGKAGDTRG
ncbi:hypothetical protein CIC12_24640 [Burkholderia sp. SG-MS1]|nr:hypothetical protein [Paraburkholderia sp. SG-MS1]